MNDELLFCRPWKHIMKMIYNKEIEICVSDIVNGNPQGTTVQYHIVIIVDGKIARLCNLSDNITQEMADEYVIVFEEGVRNIIRNNFIWEDEKSDNGIVKIWYYNIDDESFPYSSDKRFYPYFRLAITVNNIISINIETAKNITNQLKSYIFEWLDKVTTI